MALPSWNASQQCEVEHGQREVRAALVVLRPLNLKKNKETRYEHARS
jgi:hypothetical protein